jgi:hypothetical protein
MSILSDTFNPLKSARDKFKTQNSSGQVSTRIRTPPKSHFFCKWRSRLLLHTVKDRDCLLILSKSEELSRTHIYVLFLFAVTIMTQLSFFEERERRPYNSSSVDREAEALTTYVQRLEFSPHTFVIIVCRHGTVEAVANKLRQKKEERAIKLSKSEFLCIVTLLIVL